MSKLQAQENEQRMGVLLLKNISNQKINIKHSANIDTMLTGLVQGFGTIDSSNTRYKSLFSKGLKADMMKFSGDKQALYNNFVAIYAVVPNESFISPMKTWFYRTINNAGDYNIYATFESTGSEDYAKARSMIYEKKIKIFSLNLFTGESTDLDLDSLLSPRLIDTIVNNAVSRLATPGMIEHQIDMVDLDDEEDKLDTEVPKSGKIEIEHYITKKCELNSEDIIKYLDTNANISDEVMFDINKLSIVVSKASKHNYNLEVNKEGQIITFKRCVSLDTVDTVITLLSTL